MGYRMSKHDREELLKFTGLDPDSTISSENLIHKAASIRPEEKEFDERQTHHNIYTIPAVSNETMYRIFSEIAESEEGRVFIAAQFSELPPDQPAADQDKFWKSTRVRLVDEYSDILDDYETDVLDAYKASTVYGYSFTFITDM